MEIKFNRTVDYTDWLTRFQAVQKHSRAAQTGVSMEESTRLERKLDNEPDVRSEVVEKGKKLVRQADYPPAATIHSIARLLASEFDQEQ